MSASTSFRSRHTQVILPFLPESAGQAERDIYMAFIRSMRDSAQRRMDVRVLTAMYRAADLTANSDAYVARVLVDMGLLAGRLAFPGGFLDHVDASVWRENPLRALPASYKALLRHWEVLGEDMQSVRWNGTKETGQVRAAVCAPLPV